MHPLTQKTMIQFEAATKTLPQADKISIVAEMLSHFSTMLQVPGKDEKSITQQYKEEFAKKEARLNKFADAAGRIGEEKKSRELAEQRRNLESELEKLKWVKKSSDQDKSIYNHAMVNVIINSNGTWEAIRRDGGAPILRDQPYSNLLKSIQENPVLQ